MQTLNSLGKGGILRKMEARGVSKGWDKNIKGTSRVQGFPYDNAQINSNV